MTNLAQLPTPGSAELHNLVRSPEKRLLYDFLYSRRTNPPTMVEIQNYAAKKRAADHAQTQRRVRELRNWFILPAVRTGRRFVYELQGLADPPKRSRTSISRRIRGEVLRPQRCAQCGKTPLEDHVKLQVDHKVPRAWGGTDDIDNLQPLCVECNHSKQAFFSSMNPFEEQIRAASAQDEPHHRIGELLKAFQDADVEAPAQVVGTVASMKQYQEDWQKRMRELRLLGWDYTTTKRTENGRVLSFYRLTKSADWPEGGAASEIRKIEKAKRIRKASS